MESGGEEVNTSHISPMDFTTYNLGRDIIIQPDTVSLRLEKFGDIESKPGPSFVNIRRNIRRQNSNIEAGGETRGES